MGDLGDRASRNFAKEFGMENNSMINFIKM